MIIVALIYCSKKLVQVCKRKGSEAETPDEKLRFCGLARA